MALHASGEDYLEAILVLHKKMGMVRSVDVARHMEVTKPSVCHAVATLRIRRLPMKKADKNLLSGSTTLLVLSLLSSGDKYGYEMIAELEARSDHTFTLKEGTLYPILHTLEKDGAVKSYEKEAPTGRMRKYYRITRKGLRLLDEKKEEWVEFTHTVNAILAGTSPALA